MNYLQTGKLIDLYEDLDTLRRRGQLSFAGQREIVVCEWLLFGEKRITSPTESLDK